MNIPLYLTYFTQYDSCRSIYIAANGIKNISSYSRRMCIRISIAAIFSVVYIRKQFPSVGKWIHKVWFIHMIALTVIVIHEIYLLYLNMDVLHPNVDSKEGVSMITRVYYHLCTFITHRKLCSMWFMNKYMCMRLPRWLSSKEFTCNAGVVGSISRLGKYPGGGNANPLCYSSLENFMGRGAWWASDWNHKKSLIGPSDLKTACV